MRADSLKEKEIAGGEAWTWYGVWKCVWIWDWRIRRERSVNADDE